MRLTYKIHDGGIFVKESDVKTFDVENEIMHTGNAIRKLAEYEDLEELCIRQTTWNLNMLLKKWKEFFPCMVGDTVYAYCSEFRILPYTVDCIVFDDKITYQCSSYSEPIGDCPSECLDEIEPDVTDFGKTVFLTQAEAEEALKKMESEG